MSVFDRAQSAWVTTCGRPQSLEPWSRDELLRKAGTLQLPAESAVDRIGAAPAQRDREHDEAPEQRVFPAAAAGGEASRPMGHERDDRELNRERRREEAREQPEHDAARTDRLEEEHYIGERQSGLDAAPGQDIGGECLKGGGK